jgi:hypothetical protein
MLAASRASYPEGDVRNDPAVRAWIAEAAASPSAREQLRAIRKARENRPRRDCSPFAWWAWASVVEQLERRLAEASRRPSDHPLSMQTVKALGKVVQAMLAELEASRPW